MRTLAAVGLFGLLIQFGPRTLGQELSPVRRAGLGRTEKIRILVDKVLMYQDVENGKPRMSDRHVAEIVAAGFNVVCPRGGGEELANVKRVAASSRKHGAYYLPWIRGTLHAYDKSTIKHRMVWKDGSTS